MKKIKKIIFRLYLFPLRKHDKISLKGGDTMNSLEVAKRIEKLLKEKNISGAELARRVGIDRSTINRYFRGTRKIGMDEIPKFAEALGVEPLELLIGDIQNTVSKHQYTYIPTSISAGKPMVAEAVEKYEAKKIELPDSVMGKWAGDKNLFIMRVNGDSMNNIIPHNSLIAVKPLEPRELKVGDIVVYSDGGDYAVKRFFRDGPRIIFRPDSKDPSFYDYITSIDNNDLIIHGKVVLYIVELD
jgi:repressor LexA